MSKQNPQEKPDLKKAKMIDLSAHVSGNLAMRGITRPIIAAVVVHGRRINNAPAYFEKMALFGYVVVMRGRRVVTAFYDGGLA